ncbi:MAG: hypothetical protein IH582_00075 [Afipia sp.]|nr:hypothetical protein [Afipia sp.]
MPNAAPEAPRGYRPSKGGNTSKENAAIMIIAAAPTPIPKTMVSLKAAKTTAKTYELELLVPLYSERRSSEHSFREPADW